MTRSAGLVVTGVLAAALALAVAGCAPTPVAATSSAPRAAASSSPTSRPASVTAGTLNGSLAYRSAWHIAASSSYVTGAIDVCDLNLPISIEDAAALADSDTTVPIFGFVLRDGQISYGTVWPTAEPGTGIASGTGTYSVSYDASGLPTTATGTAQLSWHDASASPATSARTDAIQVTFTAEPRAGHCP